ncbi:chorismate mutase [Bradyrhizobium sp. 13971]
MIIQAGNCRRDMARIDAIPNGTCGRPVSGMASIGAQNRHNDRKACSAFWEAFDAIASISVDASDPAVACAEEPATNAPALWGSPTVDNGACCKTLGEVRSNIDRLDREIVRLMAERGRYVHEAARFKANPAQVDAPERAEAVVKRQ